LAESNAGLLVQIKTEPAGEIIAAGRGFTVTVCETLAEQLFMSVTVTLYVPEVFTDKSAETELSDHRKLTPPDAVNITEPPSQNSVGPFGVMAATGKG